MKMMAETETRPKTDRDPVLDLVIDPDAIDPAHVHLMSTMTIGSGRTDTPVDDVDANARESGNEPTITLKKGRRGPDHGR